MIDRPRRLRKMEAIRRMTRETRVDAASLVYPMFIKEGLQGEEEIPSMPGQMRYGLDRMLFEMEELADAGVKNLLLFGLPEYKDEKGSSAYAQDGIVQRALWEGKKHFPENLFLSDVCLCEYTSHGHCGMIEKNQVVNDTTLDVLAKVALSHVQAGADMVAPSDMMDGRVGRIRTILDQAGYVDAGIMAYSAKYASAFYGPFREAASSAPSFGDRKSYQMDYHNRKEAFKEVLLDIREGADIVMVKPALSYLDVIREVTDRVEVPVAAYSVSGEYAMIKAASKVGFMEEEKLMAEVAISTYRAGAAIYISYYAKELAKLIREGIIG